MLVEGEARRSTTAAPQMTGRSDTNKVLSSLLRRCSRSSTAAGLRRPVLSRPLCCVWVCGCVGVGVLVCVCVCASVYPVQAPRAGSPPSSLILSLLARALFSLSLPGPRPRPRSRSGLRLPLAVLLNPPRPFGPCLAARRGRPACGPDMLTRICGPVLLTRICGPDMLTRISGPDMLTRIGAGLRVARRRRRGLGGGGGAAARGLRAGAGGVGQRGHPSSAAPGPAPRARPLPVTLVTAHLTRMLLAGSRPPEEGGGRRCVSRVDLGVA